MDWLQALRWNWSRACRRFVSVPVSTLAARFALRLWGAKVGPGLKVSGPLRLRVQGKLILGRKVRIISGRENYVGGDRRMAMQVGAGATLEIQDDCGISNSTIVCMNGITLLEQTFIGGGCEIYDTDFHELDPQARVRGSGPVKTGPIRIGPRVFVGGRSIILKNVTIGEGAVIGAGSVVTKDVPAFEIWAGVPARPVGKIEPGPVAQGTA